ncbi:MAG: phosphatidylinositol phosphate synthase, partial [Stackebrandtia sp.]
VKGVTSRFGALLDSTMDRIADGAIFASLAYWLAVNGEHASAAAALVCLVGAEVVSYVKSRAESLGATCNVGFAERAERLVIIGIGGLLAIVGVPYAIAVAVWVLAIVTTATVAQRIWHVRGQLDGEK